MQIMPGFSYSYKVQLVNPRKIYFIDTGLLDAISVSFVKDMGRKLENIVFWHLRRQQKQLYYYNEHGRECDFVVTMNNAVENLIQVCHELNDENATREQEGSLDAIDFFNLDKGIIITMNQSDTVLHKGKKIEIIPACTFLNS